MQLFIKSVSTQVYDPLNEFVDNATFILREWVESLGSEKKKEREKEQEKDKDQDKDKKEREKDNDKEELSSPTPSLKSSLSPSSDLTIATMAELALISAKLKTLKEDEHSHIQQLRSLLGK
jgi:hypothetical protein